MVATETPARAHSIAAWITPSVGVRMNAWSGTEGSSAIDGQACSLRTILRRGLIG